MRSRRTAVRPQRHGWLADVPMAHRGLHDTAHPENSLAAFDHACASGYGIELDVLLTSDGVPVVFHDDNTVRMTGVRKDVATSRLDELKTLHLAGTDERIPTFDEVAQLVGARSPVLVEIKTGPAADVVCPAVLESLRAHNVTAAVMSFDPRVLMWLKRHSPATPRLQLSGALHGAAVPLPTKLLLRSMVTNAVTRPHGIAYDITAESSLALTFWRRVLRSNVLFWTVNSPTTLAKARRMNGNVIFEDVRP